MTIKRQQYAARKITEADLPALLEATGKDSSHRLKPGGRSYHPENSVLIVEDAGEFIGCVFIVFVRPSGWTDADDTSLFPQMTSLIINKDRRNQRAGTYLIGAVEEEVKSRGLTHLYLAVDREDLGVQRLYKRLGYEILPTEAHTTTTRSWTDSEGIVEKEVVWVIDMMKKFA
jgi:ribosomal protein S18 acetylase RimI-like enzyme